MVLPGEVLTECNFVFEVLVAILTISMSRALDVVLLERVRRIEELKTRSDVDQLADQIAEDKRRTRPQLSQA